MTDERGVLDAYDRGSAEVALLDDTIPANLARTVSEHGAREALVSCHQQIRWTYDEFLARVRRLAAGMHAAGLRAGDRLGLWAPNVAEWTLTQYATAEIGVVLVNVNPAYRTHELAYALAQSGCRWVVAAPSFKTSDYVAMVDAVRAECPTLERAVFFWSEDWDQLCAGDGGAATAELDAIRDSLSPDDPINIQYTSGTTGFPKGATLTHRNILNNGYFTTELQGLGPGDRLCIPVPFYHCFGMVMGNLGCTSHGATMVIPEAAFDPAAVLTAVQDERCTSLYGVPTMFIAELAHPEFDRFDLSSLRTGRDGRLALPGRGDEAVRRPDEHGRRHHLLRHDRDVAGGDADAARRLAAPPDRHRRTGPSARRGAHRRSGDGGDVAPWRSGRVLHSRLLGDAGLLERPGSHGRRDRRRRVDAHRRSRGDGRRRLLQHRRADQGHGHPRRREHLPARDRGVPVHTSRRRGRAGDRRARRSATARS
jgi:non-ribosomal peptide synthetase component F